MTGDFLDRFPGRQNLFGPTIGDTLLAGAYGATIELLRYPADDGDEPELHVSYEVKGEFPADQDASGFLAGLIQAMRQPRQEGGAT